MSEGGDMEVMRDEMLRRGVGEKRREKKMEKDCEKGKEGSQFWGRDGIIYINSSSSSRSNKSYDYNKSSNNKNNKSSSSYSNNSSGSVPSDD
jgi:hypothetical protein